MSIDDKQQLVEKKRLLMAALSVVVKRLVQNSAKSGRKISQEYDIGLGVISKLERCLVSDIKFSTIWKLANALEIAPDKFIQLVQAELPENYNFYE